MSRTLSLLVENKFGVLARISGLFRARGYNIDSLSVARTDDPTLSHITIVTDLEGKAFEHFLKLLDKLVDVVSVADISNGMSVARELVLLKVQAEPSRRMDILKEAELFRARVVHVGHDSYIFEATGDTGKIEAFIEIFRKYDIQEIARTGAVAMTRGAQDKSRVAAASQGT
jgi:acetolactate synthase I/III small subunit